MFFFGILYHINLMLCICWYVTVLVLKSSHCHDDQLINVGHRALTSDKLINIQSHRWRSWDVWTSRWWVTSVFVLLPPGSVLSNQAASFYKYIPVATSALRTASVLLLCKTVTIKDWEKKNKLFFFFFFFTTAVWCVIESNMIHRCNVIWGRGSLCWKVFMIDMNYGAHKCVYSPANMWDPCVMSIQVINHWSWYVSLSAFIR